MQFRHISSHLRYGRPGFFWVSLAVICLMSPLAGETVLHTFAFPSGSAPYATVIRDSAGNLYGTTFGGGFSAGVVYKVDAAGHTSVLYNFTLAADGGNPTAGVIRDSAGNLYGTTLYGGNDYSLSCPNFGFGCGVVYKLDATGQETALYRFCSLANCADGNGPYAGVIRDSAGNLYGTATGGGKTGCLSDAGCGVVFKLDAAGNETVLYSFTGGADGGNPYAGVIRDSAGNLYGTASWGGDFSGCKYGCGVVYKLDTAGHLTVLYSFAGGADGSKPIAGLLRDAAGNLYGTTSNGGLSDCADSGCGVVYKLDTAGHLTVLHSFTGRADGSGPNGGLLRDAAGNLYGTTSNGGHLSGCNGSGCGVVYKLDPVGCETVLHTFSGLSDGSQPLAGVIADATGNLYGTTEYGGKGDNGVVYKLDSTNHETVLSNFTTTDGQYPHAGVISDSAGNLYGTTTAGGSGGGGVLYEVDATGHETVLYSFCSLNNCADGSGPSAGVILDSAGNLYGTTQFGGDLSCPSIVIGCGVVYKVDPAGHETVLYTFTGGADGGNPYSGVILDSAGNLYGTTQFGGNPPCLGNGFGRGCGVVYKVDATGHEAVLYAFTGQSDGRQPLAGVILDSAGNLYGTTLLGGDLSCNAPPPYGCGVVYKVDPAGHETVLYTFTAGADGTYPYAGVISDSAGNLYGTTYSGGVLCLNGSYSCGVVYELDTAGHETVLYSFAGGAGFWPTAGVIRDTAGNLYVTTTDGGAGVVYELDTARQETVLYSFTGGADGNEPFAGVILDAAGNLYGTTEYGGTNLTGVVFRIP
jgi:uncharacterized repeat protein (TIGR03803 family)